MSEFKDLRIVDNFYQTSSFFPMPVVLASTVSESGQTNTSARILFASRITLQAKTITR